jgi:hypothetical protein
MRRNARQRTVVQHDPSNLRVSVTSLDTGKFKDVKPLVDVVDSNDGLMTLRVNAKGYALVAASPDAVSVNFTREDVLRYGSLSREERAIFLERTKDEYDALMRCEKTESYVMSGKLARKICKLVDEKKNANQITSSAAWVKFIKIVGCAETLCGSEWYFNIVIV